MAGIACSAGSRGEQDGKSITAVAGEMNLPLIFIGDLARAALGEIELKW